MHLKDLQPALVSLVGALAALLCCLLPLAVKKALEGLTGVRRADVSLATQQAVVTYDAEKVTVEQMLAAIQRAGFAARLHPYGIDRQQRPPR